MVKKRNDSYSIDFIKSWCFYNVLVRLQEFSVVLVKSNVYLLPITLCKFDYSVSRWEDTVILFILVTPPNLKEHSVILSSINSYDSLFEVILELIIITLGCVPFRGRSQDGLMITKLRSSTTFSLGTNTKLLKECRSHVVIPGPQTIIDLWTSEWF